MNVIKTDWVVAVLNRDMVDAESLRKARAEHAALVAVAEALNGIKDYAALCKGIDIERVHYLASQALANLAAVRGQDGGGK